jgi:hypothetical protein
MIKYSVTQELYVPELCDKNRDKLFVFGDNLQRKGTGGQACIRYQDNAFGIATKIAPNRALHSYFVHNLNTEAIIEAEFYSLHYVATSQGFTEVLFPAGGLGTGLSKLQDYAPGLLELIDNYVSQLINEDYKSYRE